jgi:NADH-quinone oxidoreductase subunit L
MEVLCLPLAPLAVAALLMLVGNFLPRIAVAFCGVIGILLSAITTIFLLWQSHWAMLPLALPYKIPLWSFWEMGALKINFGFLLDALSLTMSVVITVVSSAIAIFSVSYMREDEGLSRYFICMNLFVASMLVLVLADNLLLLFIGWEGVGLCSYLLIGFWYENPHNGVAARKAFLTTRVGDVALMFGLFLLAFHFGTLDTTSLNAFVAKRWNPGETLPFIASMCLLVGATGKSAQFPLQTWLPHAMCGPTPVSALIHAATMVTAGVYLIARMYGVFELSPLASGLTMAVGAFTLLIAAFSACVQKDLKRVLAYSTISQIGYMFLALGVGAYTAAIFHLITHAFFKALLFLGAGVIGHAMHNDYTLAHMGGLRTKLKKTFTFFLVGSSALVALPFVSAGYFSKDLILGSVWAAGESTSLFFAIGVVGSVLTAFYTARMLRLVFFGPLKTQPHADDDALMTFPLLFLALGTIFLGWLETPHFLAGIHVLSNFLDPVWATAQNAVLSIGAELALTLGLGVLVCLGLLAGFWQGRRFEGKASASKKEHPIRGYVEAGFGFDRFYDQVFVGSVVAAARTLSVDPLQKFYGLTRDMARYAGRLLKNIQNGELTRYAAMMALLVLGFLGISVVRWF